jgi:hypothetical protein
MLRRGRQLEMRVVVDPIRRQAPTLFLITMPG